MKNIRIGSRGSKLALVQAEQVKAYLQSQFKDINFEIQIIKTTGDKILDAPLSKIGDKGLFTKEIEQAMLENDIDLAVHSMKDMPTKLPDGLKIGAVTKRLNPSDVFISKQNKKISELLPGNTIATSSLRRKAQLLSINPELNIVDIRGNIVTRIQKAKENPNIDGLILAYAGVSRLDMEENITEIISIDLMIPPVGQAALAIENRKNDKFIDEIVSTINDDISEKAITCERTFLSVLEGGCQVPIAANATIADNLITLTGFIASLDGKTIFKEKMQDTVDRSEELGKGLANKLINLGADKILDEIYGR